MMNESWISRHDVYPFFRSISPERSSGSRRKQMLDQEPRQPHLIAHGLPALFYDQHAIEIITGQRPQYINSLLGFEVMTQCSLFVQRSNQSSLVLTPSCLNLLRQVRQFG